MSRKLNCPSVVSVALLGFTIGQPLGRWLGERPALAAGTRAGITLYVAADGNGRWSGRLAAPNKTQTDGPFASLSQAQAAIRELKRTGLKTPVNVVVRGGVYDLAQTLVFTPEDSGTETCPIVYQSQRGERVALRGGHVVRGWRPYRGGIYQSDLKAQGLEGARFHQLFCKGRRQVLARHPNLDPEHPRTGGFLYVEDQGYQPKQQFFYVEGTIPFKEWGDYPQAEVVTTYARGWNFAITPIEKVDIERRLVTIRPVRWQFYEHNRFFVQNVLGALDAPGEWYLDRKTSTLYFQPPDGNVSEGDVVVPVLDCLIAVRGSLRYPHGYLNVKFGGSREEYSLPGDLPPEKPVEYLTFRGLHFECAEQDAVRLTGARHCKVVACSVTNVGGVGINLGGVCSVYPEVGNPRLTPATGVPGGVGGAGQDLLFNDPCQSCRVAGNDVWSVGSDGIFLYGTANIAENNHTYDIGLFDKDCAAINVWGEQNIARRNDLHDVPRNAIFLKGIDNLVELNNLHRTMLETCDGGAIRMCQRNRKIRGNVIRFNRIVDTLGYGYPWDASTYQSPFYSWGIYLDDYTCGTTVFGNLIIRTGRGGVHVHGGSDNTIENNVIVDAGQYQFENNPIEGPVSGNLVCRNVFYYSGAEAFLYRCGKWIEGSMACEHNVVWSKGGPIRAELGSKRLEEWEAFRNMGLDKNSLAADPLFRNPGASDYSLRENSPAWKVGFKRLPAKEIGCYASDERALWPLQVEQPLVREKPVLYSAPVRPLREDFEVDLPGRPPRHGDILAFPRAPIVVTSEKAASGKQSLKFVDAPGLPQPWQPRLFYPLQFTSGVVRFSAEFWLDSQRPPRLYVDPRQYSDAGDSEYFSGPLIYLTQEGDLATRKATLAKVPFDQWVRIEIRMVLGDKAPDNSALILTIPGAAPRTFIVPHGNANFRRLERLVIASLTETDSAFYVDNVLCVPE